MRLIWQVWTFMTLLVAAAVVELSRHPKWVVVASHGLYRRTDANPGRCRHTARNETRLVCRCAAEGPPFASLCGDRWSMQHLLLLVASCMRASGPAPLAVSAYALDEPAVEVCSAHHHSSSLIITRHHSSSLIVTHCHSSSLIITRHHSSSLIITHHHS